MHGYPAVAGRQRLAALVVVMSLELVELAHVQVLVPWRKSSTGASRRRPFQVLSSLLDNLQTALPSLNSSKASQKSVSAVVS